MKIASFFITFALHSLRSRFKEVLSVVYKNCFDMKGDKILPSRSSFFSTFLSQIIFA